MHRHAFSLEAALVLAFAIAFAPANGAAQAAGPTGRLNDTGQTLCNNGTAMVTCDAATTGDASASPRQDGRFGRDRASPTKTGGGAAGFDFTKVCFNGALEGATGCTGTLVANTTGTASGTPGTDWACTKDNVTNLIWSLQSGLGDWTTYARTTLPGGHNSVTRCGFDSGWRLPTRRELLSIVNRDGRSPSIDDVYFPDTQTNSYWSTDRYRPLPIEYGELAWFVVFDDGHPNATYTTDTVYVRLVRSGQ
jgi:Protein of unknown function (DUF1566)